MKKTTQHQTCLKKDYKRTTMLMSIPGAGLYTFFFTFPVCLGVYYSFTDWNKIARTRNFVGFENYINALTDKRFLKAWLRLWTLLPQGLSEFLQDIRYTGRLLHKS